MSGKYVNPEDRMFMNGEYTDMPDIMFTKETYADQVDAMRERVDSIRGEICQKLAGQTLNAKTMANVLKDYRPEKQEGALEVICGRILEGIKKGQEDFHTIEEMNGEELEVQMPKQLWNVLKTFPAETRKQYLMMLFQVLSQKSGHRVDADIALYVASRSEVELVGEVSSLIQKEGQIAASELMNELQKSMTGPRNQTDPLEQGEWNEEEKLWITAVSLYAAGEPSDTPPYNPGSLGEHVGFLGGFLKKLGSFAKNFIAPAVMTVVSTAAGVFLFNNCVDWMLAGEAALCKLAFFGAESILPSAITAIVGGVGLSVGMGLAATGAVIGLIWLASSITEEKAKNQIDHDFSKLTVKLSDGKMGQEPKECVPKEYVPESEEKMKDVETEDVETEDVETENSSENENLFSGV